MNIFFLHIDPEKAAINHNYPKLQNKMILEGVQLLCATFNLHNIESPYKTTHAKHPSRLWLENSMSNILWLIDLTNALIEIQLERSGKTHKCACVLSWCKNNLSYLNISDVGITLPYLAMGAAPQIREKHGKEIKDENNTVWLANTYEDAVIAYRKYMQTKEYWTTDYTFID
jgi:hypothetical protein